MNEREQRIAIAEACGWQDVVAFDDEKVIGLPPGFTEDQCPEGADEDVPDYLHDLNAMHEVLTTQLLSDGSWLRYRSHLCDLCNLGTGMHDECAWMITHNATAAQRAEAFLRVKGLWKETTPQTKA